jgi:hypothetical protein
MHLPQGRRDRDMTGFTGFGGGGAAGHAAIYVGPAKGREAWKTPTKTSAHM